MNTNLVREQLQEEIKRLPDDIIQQIADFTLFVMARHNVTPLYEDWGKLEWQNFALSQFFREDDNVEYQLADAQEVYRS